MNTAIARPTDPSTSHLAAEVASEKREDRMSVVLDLIREFPHECQMFYARIQCDRQFFHSDPYIAGMLAYNGLTPAFKRAEDAGLIRVSGEYQSPYTGMLVQIYEAVDLAEAGRIFATQDHDRKLAKHEKAMKAAVRRQEKKRLTCELENARYEGNSDDVQAALMALEALKTPKKPSGSVR